ncbi:MAG: trigger factor, partial [Pseudomonadota bacterium]
VDHDNNDKTHGSGSYMSDFVLPPGQEGAQQKLMKRFDGGKGDGVPLVLGSGTMMPGFEDQLVGVEPGQTKDVELDFPDSIGRENLRGKHAVFAVTTHGIEAPEELVIDEAFAESVGFENLEELRTTMRERLQREFDQVSRQKTKRRLLDHLAEGHSFPVPEGMVDLEFESIWRQLEQEMKQTGQSFGDEGENEATTREEYRQIADRRVRLGLILSDIGTKNGLTVDQEELRNAVMQQARQYPGQEKEVLEFFQKNTAALEQVRAPIFEDKVVDFIFELATLNEIEVTAEELMREDEDEAEATEAGTKSAEAADDTAADK